MDSVKITNLIEIINIQYCCVLGASFLWISHNIQKISIREKQ